MLGLEPVDDSRVLGLLADVILQEGSHREGATLAHFVAVRELATTGRLVSETRAEEPTSVPWILISCRSESADLDSTDPGRDVKQLQRWFTEYLRPVGDTRWSESGLTLVYRTDHVTDAALFGHDGRLDVYTRVPVKRRRTAEGHDLSAESLEGRVVSAASLARKWHESLDAEKPINVDVSLVSVADARLVHGRRGLRRRGQFLRNHVHLAHQWIFEEDAEKRGLDDLCDRIWRSGGWPGSGIDFPEDLPE